ncbi:MAG: hypothetical protein Q9185_004387 [Variospora sp. 1 TL-2023]
MISPSVVDLLYHLGLLVFFSSILQLLRFLYLHLRPTSLPKYHHGPSPWALITGASDSIGRAIACELASHDFNIVIHGRNPSKLETVRSSLKKACPKCEIRIAVADAASPDWRSAVDSVTKVVHDIHLTVIVNHVGGLGGLVEPPLKTFEDTTHDEIEKLISLNLRFPTQLTRALLPIFSEIHGPKLILNIGSIGGASGIPYSAVYSGCKAFNHVWSQALDAEMQYVTQHGIDVLTLLVGEVTQTAWNKTVSTITVPDATTMARAAVQKIGCGRAEVVGYWAHDVQYYLSRWLPKRILGRLMVRIMQRIQTDNGKSK